MGKFQRGELLDRKNVYQGRIVDLVVDRIEVHGQKTIREVVRHPGGVVILVLTEQKLIPFVRQHRYPIDQDLLELPAGKLDDGEEPVKSAARELEEETGYRARSLEHISSFYTSPGFCDELLHFYFTDDVEKTSADPEPDEELEIEFYSLPRALELVSQGRIQDGKTITALYWLHSRR